MFISYRRYYSWSLSCVTLQSARLPTHHANIKVNVTCPKGLLVYHFTYHEYSHQALLWETNLRI